MKLEFEATQTYDIKATIDESKWGKERLAEFSEFFHDVSKPSEILEHVIDNVIVFGRSRFIEGIGYVTVNGINQGDYTKEENPLIDRSIEVDINNPFPEITEVQ